MELSQWVLYSQQPYTLLSLDTATHHLFNIPNAIRFGYLPCYQLMENQRQLKGGGNTSPLTGIPRNKISSTSNAPDSNLQLDASLMANEIDDRPVKIHPVAAINNPSRFGTWQKLGWYSALVFTGGMIVLMIAYGFLCFLWFTNFRTRMWRGLVTHNLSNIVVTLTSMVIRNMVTAQAAVASAMLAALALEQFDTTFRFSAKLNLLRVGYGTLPSHIVGPLLSSSRSIRTFTLAPLALFLFGTTALIQFTSTALLADLSMKQVPDETHFSIMPYAVSDNSSPYILNLPDGWRLRPSFYPSFAEYSEPAVHRDGIVDSGRTLRTFLPFSDSQDRLNLASYNGPSLIFDTRTVCQQPQFSNLSLSLQYGFSGALELTGNYTPTFHWPQTSSKPELIQKPEYPSFPFNCSMKSETNRSNSFYGRWVFVVCSVTFKGLYNYASNPLGSEFSPTEPRGFEIGHAYLAMNVSMGDLSELDSGRVKPKLTSSYVSGEWRISTWEAVDITVKSTLCYFPHDSAVLNVDIQGGLNRREPMPKWDNSSTRQSYSRIRSLFGQFRNETLDTRGVLYLAKKESWADKSRNISDQNAFLAYSSLQFATTQEFEQDVAIIMQNGGMMTGDFDVTNLPHGELFSEILLTGGNIAFALQTFFSVLLGMKYYDNLPAADMHAQVSLSIFRSVLAPVRMRAFIGVSVVLVVHLILVAIVVLKFLRDTQYTALDNVWHGAAQLDNKEIRDLLESSDMTLDKDLEKKMRETGTYDIRFGIGLNKETGKVSLQPRSGYTIIDD
jgi:hypothetical protein